MMILLLTPVEATAFGVVCFILGIGVILLAVTLYTMWCDWKWERGLHKKEKK